MAVSALSSVAALGGLVAASRRRALPAATAMAVQMALTLVYWEQMVRYFERNR